MVKEKHVFLSYSWDDSDEADIVQENLVQYEGINVIRDRDVVGYSEDLTEFMKTIKKTDHVTLFISDSYLKSVNCMYEVSQLIKDDDYVQKTTPILVKNVSIYSIEDRLEYAVFWNNKRKFLDEEIRKLCIEDNISLIKELQKVKAICSAVDSILAFLNRRQFYKLDTHIQNDFNDIFKAMNLSKIPRKTTGFPLEQQISIKSDYILHKLEDVSHAGAKRYSAIITLNRPYERDELKKVIVEITNELKKRKYYRNDMVKERHLDTEADVIWLFIANDTFDIQIANWICRTSWISSDLSDQFKPLPLSENDTIDDIKIDWNESYLINRTSFKAHTEVKENILSKIDKIKDGMILLGNQAILSYSQYKSALITEDDHLKMMQINHNQVAENYSAFLEIGLPPEDVKKYAEICNDVFSAVDNMYLFYSEKGTKTWDSRSRDFQMSKTINDYKEHLAVLKYEEKKIH